MNEINEINEINSINSINSILMLSDVELMQLLIDTEDDTVIDAIHEEIYGRISNRDPILHLIQYSSDKVLTDIMNQEQHFNDVLLRYVINVELDIRRERKNQ